MSFAPGTRLGPYELLALVGAGGMGEVYRARDTRLDRTVAIKVLADLPARGPSTRAGSDDASSQSARRRERFEREAHAVSRLNHPHICTLHDIGREGDVDFLVMEYVEGETLAARLRRGPLPLVQAIRASVETADALARAHAAGVIHRDLKPANIMLTRAGVKLLDFGIAKVLAPADRPDAEARTQSDALTTEGTILGTMQYMAPEQLEGKALDARTDIFAFGAVMYETITGRPAFDAGNAAGLIGAILRSTPPSAASLQPLTPQALDRLIMTCLAKAPEDRWQSSLDLLRELRWIADRGDDATPAPPAGFASPSRARQVALLGTCLVAGTLLGGGVMRWLDSATSSPPSSSPIPIKRLPLPLVSGDVLESADSHRAGPSLDLSPDGTKLVYVARRRETTRLMLRSMDQLDAIELPGTEDASTPFFSPDGEWVGFMAREKLKKIATAGGRLPLVLGSVPPVTRGASWGPDGTIYVSLSFSDAIFRMPDSGGRLTKVTALDPGEANHLLPHVLPGGQAVIFTVWNGGSFADASLWAWSAATGERKKLLESASCGRYASGYLVFARDAALLAVPFDPMSLEVKGPSVPIADGVDVNATNGTTQFAVSADGTLVYAARAADTAGADRLVWVDRKGREQPVSDIQGEFEVARLSPDGRRVAVQNLNDLWINELGTSVLRRLTFTGVNQYPVWSPDGARIAFSHPIPGGPTPSLFWTAADGSGQPEAIVKEGGVLFPSDWSRNDVLAFSRTSGVGGNWDILTWARQSGQTSVAENSTFNELQPAFSPDGRWLAYVSDSSTRREVYVRPYPDSGARVQVSSGGGEEPRWGPDSRELFFVQGRRLMRATISTTPKLGASNQQELFEGRHRRSTGSPGFTSYSVSPDGQRFLMIKPADTGAGVTSLTLVIGGFEALPRRAR